MRRGESIIYVVDDDEAVRHSLKWLLESAGITVRTFEAAQPFLDQIHTNHDPITGCALIDLRLPGMSGLELQQQLNDITSDLPVIMITGHGDVPAAVNAMKAGAIDFIQKPFDETLLLNRVQEALRATTREPARSTEDQAQLSRAYDRLSPRERQVMAMVVTGWLNKQIASELSLSHKTVEVHRAHAMEKMGAASLAELVRMAVALEQIEPAAEQRTRESGPA